MSKPGRVLQTDHGNLEREELDAWETFEDYVADLLFNLGEDSDPDEPGPEPRLADPTD